MSVGGTTFDDVAATPPGRGLADGTARVYTAHLTGFDLFKPTAIGQARIHPILGALPRTGSTDRTRSVTTCSGTLLTDLPSKERITFFEGLPIAAGGAWLTATGRNPVTDAVIARPKAGRPVDIGAAPRITLLGDESVAAPREGDADLSKAFAIITSGLA